MRDLSRIFLVMYSFFNFYCFYCAINFSPLPSLPCLARSVCLWGHTYISWHTCGIRGELTGISFLLPPHRTKDQTQAVRLLPKCLSFWATSLAFRWLLNQTHRATVNMSELFIHVITANRLFLIFVWKTFLCQWKDDILSAWNSLFKCTDAKYSVYTPLI